MNYGEVPASAEDLLAGACPVVASFGGRDKAGRLWPERLERALTVRQIPHDVKLYPGSGHRFMSQSGGAAGVLARVTGMGYQRHDAADSWARIYAFFGTHLQAGTGSPGASPGG